MRPEPKPRPGSYAAHKLAREERRQIELEYKKDTARLQEMGLLGQQPSPDALRDNRPILPPDSPNNLPPAPSLPRPPTPPSSNDDAQHDFEARFHRFNVAGSIFTALSNVGCGLGSFAHIGESCTSSNSVLRVTLRKCVSAGFGMSGVLMGVLGAGAGVGLAISSLHNGEGRLWRRFNCTTSALNLLAAMASGAPAMYSYFNHKDPDVCGRGAANNAAFAGFWISLASATALYVQSSMPENHRLKFRAANGANTALSAVAAILAASPDLCATNQTVHHRGGGQAFVAIMNCLGVVAGAIGGTCATIGAFGP